jgi:DNA-binding NtrC family response regulator
MKPSNDSVRPSSREGKTRLESATALPAKYDAASRAAGSPAADLAASGESIPASGLTRTLRILVVDDEKTQRDIVAKLLEDAGYEVETAAGLPEAYPRVELGGIDLVLTDLRMSGGSGIDLLRLVKESRPDIEVILTTAFSSVETAVEAMRRGAFHYLPKPFRRDELLDVVAQVGERARLRHENEALRSLLVDRFGVRNLLGRSAGMQAVFRTIEKVASNAATVLVRGESGTGKELVARAIHASGTRRDRPFVAINCAAIPELLIESELFGHEKGAFTGAISTKNGRLEEAGDGTLFLDEIGSMQYELQSKLLRVIQEREFQRIGGSRIYPFRARIVAATSVDLERRMRENQFRSDLYFRLNVVPIELPPLRERDGDVPPLAVHFLRRYASELGKKVRAFAPEVMDRLEAYDWPGNVRELENVVQRMIVLADDATETLGVEDLPGDLRNRRVERYESDSIAPIPGLSGDDRARSGRAPADGEAFAREGAARSGSGREESVGFVLPEAGIVLEELEQSFIRQALDRSGGRLEPAARLLGISYKTLQYRIKKFGLQHSTS